MIDGWRVHEWQIKHVSGVSVWRRKLYKSTEESAGVDLDKLFEDRSSPTDDERVAFQLEFGVEYPDQILLDQFFKKIL